MTILGTEGLVDSIIDELTTSLSLKLVEVDNRYDAKVDLENITEWRIDDPLQQNVLPQSIPIGWVVSPLTQIDQWNPDHQYTHSDFVVWILLADQDSQTLKRRVSRTMLAIWEVLRDMSKASEEWKILETPTVDFSELLTGRDSLFYGDARLRLRIHARELVADA